MLPRDIIIERMIGASLFLSLSIYFTVFHKQSLRSSKKGWLRIMRVNQQAPWIHVVFGCLGTAGCLIYAYIYFNMALLQFANARFIVTMAILMASITGSICYSFSYKKMSKKMTSHALNQIRFLRNTGGLNVLFGILCGIISILMYYGLIIDIIGK